MSTSSKKNILKIIKQRKYLNKDFDGFKSDLVQYSKTHFNNINQDLSENGIVGMLLEMASYIGDVQSYYLDHQFHELNPETAVEDKNIEAHLRNAGIKVVGASPAVVTQEFLIEVPAIGTPAEPSVAVAALPIIHQGTIVPAGSNIFFELTEDLDFYEKDENNLLIAKVKIGKRDSNNNPTTFILSREGLCVSGFVDTESFSIGDFVPYKKFTLSKENITEIIKITDSLGNEYYEVDNLGNDTVFQTLPNLSTDRKLVKDKLFLKPAPFRFISDMSLKTRLTTLTFGGGSAESLDDDIIPDPSEFSIPLYGKKNFTRFTLNPNNLLQTTTLGVIAPNSTLTVQFRYGGGLSHNVPKETIRGFSTLLMTFPNDPIPSVAQSVRSSADSINRQPASGGEDAPTKLELKDKIPAAKFAQERIVTKPDIIARIYTMPSNLGRVFRASTRVNPTNPLATNVFIVSRNANSQLIVSPDTLKENLEKYLNEYRLTNDAIDILDAQIVNFTIEFVIAADPRANRQLVKQNIIKKLTQYFNIKNFEIDQPIIIDDVKNIIFNNEGVLSISNLYIRNIAGAVVTEGEVNSTSEARVYANTYYDMMANSKNNIIFPPDGGIFELRFAAFDIKGTVI